MSHPTPGGSSADRNLLFGILAVQMDFVSRDALIAAMHAWVLAKHRSLGELLSEQGALTAEHRQLLEQMTAAHLRAHGDDAHRSLAALGHHSTLDRGSSAAFKQLAADFPDVPGHQARVANSLLGLADVARGQHQEREAIQFLDEALPAIQKALRANPRDAYYRGVSRSIRRSRAQAQLGLGEHAAAAAAAEEMLPFEADPPKDAHTAACVLAQCVSLADKDAKLSEPERRELARRYADRAMALLSQAVAKGYKDVAKMEKEQDLDALRSRDDFKKLLADLKNSAPRQR